MSDNQKGMMEGLGGPLRMDPYTFDGIDPALDDCCRREVGTEYELRSRRLQFPPSVSFASPCYSLIEFPMHASCRWNRIVNIMQ